MKKTIILVMIFITVGILSYIVGYNVEVEVISDIPVCENKKVTDVRPVGHLRSTSYVYILDDGSFIEDNRIYRIGDYINPYTLCEQPSNLKEKGE